MILSACKHDQTRKFGKDRKGNPRVQCALCGKTWTVVDRNPLGSMRIDMETAEQIIKQLCEGTSIRATARLTNTDPHTVIDLLLLVGERCRRYMLQNIRDVAAEEIQVDEAWQFIYCKERTAAAKHYGPHVGDSYVFTGIERNTKLLIAWHFGKRDGYHTDLFCRKLAQATAGRFQLSTDAFIPYRDTVPRTFGARVDFGMVVKIFGKSSADDQRQYSPAKIKGMKRESVHNWPDMSRICTSHCERMNLTFRTFMRRMGRLTCSFSKKWANHEAALGLFIMHYNYRWIHSTIKTTPAIASGIENHRWTVRELIERTSTY